MINEPNDPMENSFRANGLNPQEIERIWEQRAIQMAHVEIPEEPGEQLTIVMVRLGDELLGLEVRWVSAIRPLQVLTRVPRVPAWVLGVTSLRGRIISVIDLRLFLGLPPAAQPAEGKFVTVQTPAMELIFAVDDVPGVDELPLCHDLAEEVALHHLPTRYVRAVVEHRGLPGEQAYITVLELDALLTDSRLIIHEELT
jgi:purine-binding chemotaxis protein CheW